MSGSHDDESLQNGEMHTEEWEAQDRDRKPYQTIPLIVCQVHRNSSRYCLLKYIHLALSRSIEEFSSEGDKLRLHGISLGRVGHGSKRRWGVNTANSTGAC
jgi:hypothetical protein